MFKRLIPLFKLISLCVTLLVLAATQSAVADGQPGKTLIGAWVVTISSDFGLPAIDTTTVNRDGTMTNSDALFGTGHGVWKHAGASQFDFKFMTPVLVTAGLPPGSMLTVTGTLTVNDGGMDAFGPFQAIVRDALGNDLFPFSGTVDFVRITIDDGG